MKKYQFIPAMSAGSLFSGALKNRTWEDGTPYRYWNWDNEFRYPYFLITAGHFYKKENVSHSAGLLDKPDTVVFGDSGGFQIAKGSLKWNPEIREKIFHWLENNSTVAANLDIPALGKNFGFKESLEISVENFRYFHEKQTGKTDFLNVLQGFNDSSYNKWYNHTNEFRDFAGWCIGNSRSSPANLFSAVYTLIRNKEHLRSKIWHILGTSDPLMILLLCHMQNAFNRQGLDLQVYSDSSSSNSARFGAFYSELDVYNLGFKTIHIPYLRKDFDDLDDAHKEIFTKGVDCLPVTTEYDKHWKKLITNEDLIQYSGAFTSALSLRNTMMFIESFDKLDKYSKLPYYFRKEIFKEKYTKLGSLMETMIDISNDVSKLDNFYSKNKLFFKQFEDHTSSKDNTINHNFFN